MIFFGTWMFEQSMVSWGPQPVEMYAGGEKEGGVDDYFERLGHNYFNI